MAETIYTYAISTDLPGGKVNPARLQAEIDASSISTACYINTIGGSEVDGVVTGGTLEIVAADVLSGADKTTLDGGVTQTEEQPPLAGSILADHNNALNDPVPSTSSSVDFPTFETKSTTYAAVGNFGFAGSDEIGAPLAIRAICGVTTATSIDIRVRDVTNNTTIAEKLAVTDSYPTIVDLGTISNVTTDVAVWEFQLRRNTGSGNQKVSGSSLVVVY